MKIIYTILFALFVLVHPALADETGQIDIIEKTVLWRAKLDSTWKPVAMSALVEDTKLFSKEGNFYKPISRITIFGHELVYAGLLGIDLYPGPNVTLIGSPKSVRDAITKSEKLKIEEVEGGYVAELKKDIKLLIFPHPSKTDQTIVIGAYLGL